MPYNLPHRIRSEEDLKYFEEYLKLEKGTSHEARTMSELLKKLLGKPIKIDLGNSRYIGILSEIGNDYLTLCQNQSYTKIMIPLYSVKAISFNRC